MESGHTLLDHLQPLKTREVPRTWFLQIPEGQLRWPSGITVANPHGSPMGRSDTRPPGAARTEAVMISTSSGEA